MHVKPGAYKSTSNNYTVQCPMGSLNVRTRRKRLVLHGKQVPMESSQEETLEVWDAHLIFLPCKLQKAQISIAFQQQLLHHGSFLKMPGLSVSALLPKTSKVFKLIRNGDLDGLVKSLSLREARLTDRDEAGRCLLNVGLHIAPLRNLLKRLTTTVCP